MDGRLFGTCAAIKLLPVVEIIQNLDNIIVFSAVNSTTPQRIVDVGKVELTDDELEEALVRPGSLIKIDGDVNNAIKWLDFPTLPSDIFNFKQELLQFMDDYEGITAVYEGAAPGSVQGSGGVETLNQRAGAQDTALLYR